VRFGDKESRGIAIFYWVFLFAEAVEVWGAVPIIALTFSPDGTALVSNGDRHLELRSPKEALLQGRLDCDLPRITSLAFAPDGRVLAVGGGEPGVRGEVRLYSWPEGTVLSRLGEHTDLVTKVTFSENGKRLGVAASDHSARVWNVENVKEPAAVLTLTGHVGPVLGLVFSPSGQSLVTASVDRSLKVWSSEDGRLLRSFGQHTEAIQAVTFRPRIESDATPFTCVSAGDDRTVRVWQPELGRLVRIVRQHEGPIFALVWSADGQAIFSAGQEGIIRRIDGSSDTLQAQWRAHDDWIYALALSPDGATLASGDWSGRVRVHDLRGVLEAGPIEPKKR